MTLRPLALSDQEEFCTLVRASSELHQPWMQLPGPRGVPGLDRRFEDGTAWAS